MKESKQVEDLARQLRNQKAKEWRDSNKEKVKAINQRYWLKRAKKILDEKTSKEVV